MPDIFEIDAFFQNGGSTVYAYEPIPSIAPYSSQNVALNPSLGNRIHLFNKAVTGKPQNSLNYLWKREAENSVSASIYSDFDEKITLLCGSRAISLARYWRRLGLSALTCEN